MKHPIALVTLLLVSLLLARPAPAQSVVDARVLDVTQKGDDVEVTLDQGSNAGITTSWHGELLDDQGQPVAGARFTVLRVRKRSTVVLVKNAHFRRLADTAVRARLTP